MTRKTRPSSLARSTNEWRVLLPSVSAKSVRIEPARKQPPPTRLDSDKATRKQLADLRGQIVMPAGRPDRELLAEGVARSLAQYVATSRLAPDQLLPSESALAHMFRVSTRTVREALRILAEQGVVRTSQGRRAVVSDWRSRAMKRSLEFARFLGKDSLTDLLELRFALEPRAAALAALRSNPADVRAIEEALERMKAAGTAVDAWGLQWPSQHYW